MESVLHFPFLGAVYLGEGRTRFRVWAPFIEQTEVHIVAPDDRIVGMDRQDDGYWLANIDDVEPGARYYFRLNGERDRPDPASRYQPDGVHGPSEVVDPAAFEWHDATWTGASQLELVIYELHVGTFTPDGTFDAAIDDLDRLRDLGVTAIEVMPVNQFPGSRNWGYDGVQIFAAQNSYGGPDGLRRLVDACHQRGMAVILDVVYNHFGPEGNYLAEYGPYFTDTYLTPWGPAVNFDDQGSDEVRRFFIENGLHWMTSFHIDGFRLDAIHAIKDESPLPFLQEFTAAIHQHADRLGRRVYVIAESNMNSPRVVNPATLGGFGMDAEWSDDFHHALHAYLTGERVGYYRDYGRFEDLVRVFREGYVYTGQHSSFRDRKHGNVPRLYQGQNFVVCSQNHDQTGNRSQGDRLSTLVTFESLKLAAGIMLLSPYIPLLFMGEEYGETAPFQYFVSHSDPDLVEAVRQGRRQEFASFEWPGEVPDPQDEATFARSRLNRDLLREPRHQALADFYRELLRLRRETTALADLDKHRMEVIPYYEPRVMLVKRWSGDDQVGVIYSFSQDSAVVRLPFSPGRWERLLASADERWHGPGTELPQTLESDGEVALQVAPLSCNLFVRSSQES